MSIIKSYLTDIIEIVKQSIDEFGAVTYSVTENIQARIEDSNKLIYDQNGKEMYANSKIIIEDNIDIEYNDKIRLKKINKVNFEQSDKDFTIKKLAKRHGFEATHYTIYI